METTQNEALEASPRVNTSAHIPAFYADRLYNIGVGPGIAKLTFANESGPNELTLAGQVIIPTAAFLEALDYISKSMLDNPAFFDNIANNLSKFLEKLQERANR